MDYKLNLTIGQIVTATRTYNGEVITGEFRGFRLYNDLNPDSVVGLVSVAGDRIYDVLVNSINYAESEDERIRKALIDGVSQIRCKGDVTREQMIAYLEKQKYDRMKPIYDARESFESALEKAWNDYHNGYENVDKLEDDYVECAHAKGFREGYLFGIEKQKEQKPTDYPYLPGWRKNRDDNKPELKHSVLMLTTHGVAEGEWLGEKWCQYRWSCELKDGEVLYWMHLSDLERLEKESEEKQKEQKPVDPSDDELQRHQDELYNFKVFAAKQAKEYHISFVHDFEWNNFCAEILSYFNEQKPAEWSKDYREEDIQTRFAFYTYKDDPSVLYLSNVFVEEASRNHGFGTRILKAAEKAAEAIGAITICLKVKQDSPANAWYRKNGYGYVAFEDGYDWLEKNLEYLKPAKSAKWSEEEGLNRTYEEGFNDGLKYRKPVKRSSEDKKMSDWLIGLVNANTELSFKDKVNLTRWLEHLTIEKELSENDKRIMDAIMIGYQDKDFRSSQIPTPIGVSKDEVIDWLKSLRPSWKPSKEQMELLNKVYHYLFADKYATVDMQDGLGDFIDELKEL